MPRALACPCHAFLLVAALAGGCAGEGADTCRVGADCASGMCRADGTCVPVPSDDHDGGPPADVPTGPETGARADGGSATRDGAGQDGSASRDDAALPGCSPDHDGVIERAEVPLMAGLRATYRVTQDVEVDTAGTVLADGTRRWDLSDPLPGDHSVLVEARPIEGDAWYAERFEGASYVAPLRDGNDLLGVFEITGTGLLLRGVVSPDDGWSRTELEYDPAVDALSFPLTDGAAWSTDADVSGWAQGVVAAYDEVYESEIDASGELVTPFGTFPVKRVRVVLTRTVGFTDTVVRTFLFVAECFGTVAAVVSQDDETREEFTRAAEVRRLAP